MTKSIYKKLIDLLYPRKCLLCRELLQEGENDLCIDCRTNMPIYPFGYKNPVPRGKSNLHFLDSCTAVWYYEGNVRCSLLRFKFYRGTSMAGGYGRMLADKIRDQGPEDFDCLTWIPVSSVRRFRRGYDQAQLIAAAVGKELGIELVRVLKKRRNTPPQSTMKDITSRKANILGAFQALNDADIKGKRVLLVDDIFTTGATSEECARILKTAGAKEVHCAVVAAVRNR